jgi:hypothetical protein
MKFVGKFFSGVVLAAGALAAVVGFRSIPDLKRYLRMRKM